MRLHFAVELPFYWVGFVSVQVVLFEESNAVVGVAGGKIAPTVAGDNLCDWIATLSLVTV